MTSNLSKRGKIWYLRIDMGTDPETGKRVQKSISTKCTKKPDAQLVQLEIMDKLNKGIYTDSKEITFVDFMDDWLESKCKKNIQLTTYESYRCVFDGYIKPYFKASKIKLQELQPIHLEKYYSYLLTKGRKTIRGNQSAGLSPNTIQKHHANISKCLDYALKNQLVVRNVALAVEIPKKTRFKGQAYNANQLKELIAITKDQPIQVAIILASSLGLRRGEVCGLKWQNVDFDKELISIEDTRTRYSSAEIVKDTKNLSSERVLPMPDFLIDYLKGVKKKQKEMQLLCGSGYIKTDYVCTMPDGNPLKVNYISQKFKAIIDGSDLPKIRYHDLRHTNATLLLQKNLNIKWVSEWLGHSTITTTMDIYAHVTHEMKKEVADEVNNIFAM